MMKIWPMSSVGMKPFGRCDEEPRGGRDGGSGDEHRDARDAAATTLQRPLVDVQHAVEEALDDAVEAGPCFFVLVLVRAAGSGCTASA